MSTITVETIVLVQALAVMLAVQAVFALFLAFRGGTSRVSYALYYVMGSIIGPLAGWIALIVLPQLG